MGNAITQISYFHLWFDADWVVDVKCLRRNFIKIYRYRLIDDELGLGDSNFLLYFFTTIAEFYFEDDPISRLENLIKPLA